MRASDYLEAALCNNMRGTALALPSNLYVALHTADPTDAAITATEVQPASVWPTYARQSLGTLSTAWTALAVDANRGNKQYIANANALAFPINSGAASVTVTHVSIWDAASGGNMWFHGPLTNLNNGATFSITVAQGQTFKLPAGVVRVYPATTWSTYFRDAFVGHLSGVQMQPWPAVYVGLDASDATLGGALVTEITTGAWPSYARVAVGTPSAGWSSPATEDGGGQYSANTSQLDFAAFDGASNVTVTAYEIWDAATGGNMLFRAALGATEELSEGKQYFFVAGGLRQIWR
jgi:hypothetical protein